MPDHWNAETYRERSRRWQEKVDSLLPGREHDACVALAEGYAHLAELIEKSGLTKARPAQVLSSGNLRRPRMKEPHTEESVQHSDDQQNTGNHKKPGQPDTHGADRFGGTRTGMENVKPTKPAKP